MLSHPRFPVNQDFGMFYNNRLYFSFSGEVFHCRAALTVTHRREDAGEVFLLITLSLRPHLSILLLAVKQCPSDSRVCSIYLRVFCSQLFRLAFLAVPRPDLSDIFPGLPDLLLTHTVHFNCGSLITFQTMGMKFYLILMKTTKCVM